MMRRMGKHALRALVLASLLLLALGMSAQAAPAKKGNKGWVKKKNQVFYYVDKKPVKGLQKIGKHEYYFNSKGVQGTSWRKIGSDYYYFRCEEKAEGYLVKNKTQNGIRLGKDGKAILSSGRAKKKADLMARVSVLLDKIISKQKSVLKDRNSRLKACYDYLRKNYPYRVVGHFRKTRDFDLECVDVVLTRGYADCHPYAFTFGYLTNALGYSNVTVCSWYTKNYGGLGHSWVMLGNKVYDVSLGRHHKKSYELFGISWTKYHRKYTYYRIKRERHLDEL